MSGRVAERRPARDSKPPRRPEGRPRDDLDRLHEDWMKDPEYRRAHAEEELTTRVAIHVRRRRRALGWTQEQLAKHMGKRRAWIGRVELGDENLTLRSVGQFAYALELENPAALLRPVDEEPAPRSRRRARAIADPAS